MTALALLALAQIPAIETPVKEGFALRWSDMYAGTGALAEPGQRYRVHYTGWLTDGTKFDSSRDRNEPFHFVQGQRQVISGWDAGFEGMRVGGRRRLFIPYQMAYGEKGRGPIPPKAELIFDVELLGVETIPEIPASAELLAPIGENEKKLSALAQAFPENKYDWRPAPGVRSVREVLLHVAHGNRLMLDLAEKTPDAAAFQERIAKQIADEKAALTKEQTLAKLADSFAEIRKTVEPMRAGVLGSSVEFFGRKTTRRGVYIELAGHIAEHLGQLIAYARMNGVKPPWSE
jgi:peptidylprolyl isomerase